MTLMVGMEVLVVRHDEIEGRARVTKQLKNGNFRCERLGVARERDWLPSVQFRQDGYRASRDDSFATRPRLEPMGSPCAQQLLAKRHRYNVAKRLETLAYQFRKNELSPEAVTAIEDVVARFT